MKKIDKNLKILIGVAIVFIVGIGALRISNQSEIEGLFQETAGPITFQKEDGGLVEEKITLIIDNGAESANSFQSDFKEGLTAFDLLKEGTEELNLFLKTKTYDIGVFIEVIGDKKNGEDGKYWLYYINGEMPMVAADKEELKPGDKVEFKFEKSLF